VGVRRLLGDIYRQITYVPKSDKKFSGSWASKNCVDPTAEEMLKFAPKFTNLLYSNPFWDDPRILYEDKTVKKIYLYANAIPANSRSSSFPYFFLILAIQLFLCVLWQLKSPSVNFSFGLQTEGGAFGVLFYVILILIAYDLLRLKLISTRARFNRYLRLMVDSGCQTLSKYSHNDYQKWLKELRDSDFSKFVEIQRWQQQERLLEASKRQSDAFNRAASLAAITAFNTARIRSN
jgi:hypothetical protein